MKNKLAKLKYLPNKFEIIEPGDHVICAVSKQKIYLQNLNYWNVELQEAYFSYKEAQLKREAEKKRLIISTYRETISIEKDFFLFFLSNHWFSLRLIKVSSAVIIHSYLLIKRNFKVNFIIPFYVNWLNFTSEFLYKLCWYSCCVCWIIKKIYSFTLTYSLIYHNRNT